VKSYAVIRVFLIFQFQDMYISVVSGIKCYSNVFYILCELSLMALEVNYKTENQFCMGNSSKG